jgi:hypothetical protein
MTDTSTTQKQQAQEAASTAADEGKHVAGVAQQEAGRVAGEAADQARSVVADARTQVSSQVGDQARQQRDNAVSTLGSFSEDLSRMADSAEGDTVAASVAREVAHHTRNLTSYLDGREPGELLDDVRDFARRRPGTFLLGALAAGVVAGRLARGVKDADSGPSGSSSGAAGGTTGAPTATPTGYGDPASALPPPPAPTPASPTAAPTTPTGGAGLGTDAAGYGRGQDLPGSPA